MWQHKRRHKAWMGLVRMIDEARWPTRAFIECGAQGLLYLPGLPPCTDTACWCLSAAWRENNTWWYFNQWRARANVSYMACAEMFVPPSSLYSVVKRFLCAGSHVQSVTGGTQKRHGKSGVTAYRSLLSRHHQTKHQSKSLMQNADLCACWQMPRVSEASIKPCRLPLGAQPTAFTQAVGVAKVPHAWVANGSWNIASQIREIRKIDDSGHCQTPACCIIAVSLSPRIADPCCLFHASGHVHRIGLHRWHLPRYGTGAMQNGFERGVTACASQSL